MAHNAPLPALPRAAPRPGGVSFVFCVAALLSNGCEGPRPADGVVSTGTLTGGATEYRRATGYATTGTSAVQLWFETFGNDPAGTWVVLLSGNDSPAIYWPEEIITGLLNAGYQVLRYDPRDVGLSEWLPFPAGFDPRNWTPAIAPPYTLRDNAVDLADLMDTLSIERAHLVGVSAGGMIAQVLALEQPARVLSLALLSTSPSNPYDPSIGAIDETLLEYVVAQYPKLGLAASLSWLTPTWLLADLQADLLTEVASVAAADRAALREFVVQSIERAPINPASSQGFAIASAASRLVALGSITVPTLIVHGRNDAFIPASQAEAMARAIPGAVLALIVGGHGFPASMYLPEFDTLIETLRRGDEVRER